MTLAGAKTRLLNLRQWELNPVVVKELRQAVRSWAVTGMLMFFLVVLFGAMVIFLVNQSIDIRENTQAGADIFSVFLVILAVASMLFIPLYVGVRMVAERQENNADLLYISTLSPLEIIFGKFVCGAYVIVLFFSACMPFLAFTNLLRGVDLPTIFLIMAFLFGAVCAANMLAIFIACLPVSRIFKLLLGLGQLIVSVYLVGAAVAISFEMMRLGAGSMMGAVGFWETAATVACIVAMVGGLLFVLSVALISPPSANRSLLVRIYVTMIWLLSGALTVYWVWRSSNASVIFAWCDISTVLLVAALAMTISDGDQLSLRVRRSVPKSRLPRVFAFPFFNGAAGGLVWVISLFAITFLVPIGYYSFADKTARSSQVYSEFIETYPPMLAYALAYALTGLFLQRTFLPRRRAVLAGVFASAITIAAVAGPTIVLFCMNELSWKMMERLQLGNASNLLDNLSSEQRMEHLWFASAWLAIVVLLNAKWFVRQVNNFRPLEKVQPATAPALSELAEAPPAALQ